MPVSYPTLPSPPPRRRGRPERPANPWRRGLRMAAFAGLLFSIGFVTAFAGTPAGYTEYIIPFDEDIFAYVTDPVATGAIAANNTTFTLVSVTAWSDTVTVYYDHWENGYNFDLNNPDVTADEKYALNAGQTLNFQSLAVPRPRTGADGNTYIGAAGDCPAQPTPTAPLIHNTLNYCYDGRDRVISIGGATTATRAGFFNAPGPGKLAAIGEEVYPLSPQLTKYILPFGEYAPVGTRNDYDRVLAVIQATEDNTTIQIDFNGDGRFDWFNTEDAYRNARVDGLNGSTLVLQKGQSYILDRDSDGVAALAQNAVDPGNPYVGSPTLNRGTVILGSATLQVEYFYGRDNSNYDTRAVSAFPRGFWSDEYYASADGGNSAVCGGACNTDILLYNPNSSDITINWETAAGSGSFILAANTTEFFSDPGNTGSYVPDGSGVYLKGSGVFWGTSDIDANANNWDWGYSLVPSYLLSDDQTVAWAPGNSPTQACNTANARGNGLFLTPASDNTTFFIDTNGDGVPETNATNASLEVLLGQVPVAPTGLGYRVDRLQSVYITGSNSGTLATSPCDLTGARIYATGPFSMSYGENPDKTSLGGGLDLGYTALPSPGNWMDLALTVDKASNPVLVSTVAAATDVTFTLVVDSHLFNIDSLSVVDTLPANWAFVNNSAVITLPNLTQITGAAANPTGAPGPVLTWPTGLLGNLLPNQRVTIAFTARTTAAFASGAVTQNNVRAVGTRTVGGVTQTFRATDFALNTFVDPALLGMQIAKTSSVPLATPVSPGDALAYTITVSNPAATTLTGVSVSDFLPPGFNYTGGSVTCSLAGGAHNVRDEFTTDSSYLGNNGSNNWAGPWTEQDLQSAITGASAGFALVTGNRLRFRYQTHNVNDLFNSTSYARQDGSIDWLTDWVETGDDGAPGTGDITADVSVANMLAFGNAGAASAAGKTISRTAAVYGGNATLGFTLSDQGIDAGEGVIVEYQLDAGPFLEVGRITNATIVTGAPNPLTFSTAGASTITVRIRSFDTGNATFEAGDFAGVDNLGITFDAFGASAQRTVDLTAATTPQLTFTVPATANLEATDTLVIEASTSPTGPFTTLATYTGAATAGVQPYNLTPYISATTTIRFRITGNYDQVDEFFEIDNVNIAYNLPASATFASGPPPNLLTSAAPGCVIPSGGSLTVTLNGTVDNPFPAGLDEILNTAFSSATQIPVPVSASARNIVVAPVGSTGTVGDRVWLDANANGAFDPGESGIAGVEVTLKDQFGTPVQVLTTDSQGRYTFIDVPAGAGYFVEITGGMPVGVTNTFADAFNTNGVFTGNNGTLNFLSPWTENNDDANAAAGDIRIANNRLELGGAGLTVEANDSIQRSATVTGATSLELSYSWAPLAGNFTDNFNTNGSFTGNNGTANFLTNWTENNDDANAAAGDIRIANNRIEFGGAGLTVEANDSIQRSATVTGSTSLTLQYSWNSAGLETDNSDEMVVEYSIDGAAWTVLRTLNGDPAGNFTDTIPWTPANTTAFVRFRALDPIEAGEQAFIDNVVLTPDGTDRVVAEYSIDGAAWTPTRTLGSTAGNFTDTIPWTPTNNTAFLRFRALDPIEAGEQARIDNVVLSKVIGSGLVQTTDTVGDTFPASGVFTGNTGTLNWLTGWDENNDDDVATAGDIRIAATPGLDNRIEFGGAGLTVEANDSIQRSVTVSGATSIEVQYAWEGTGLVVGVDRMIVEYSVDGAAWTTLRTIDAAAATTFTDTLAWAPTNNTFHLRYRAQDALEPAKVASIDDVQVRFVQPLRTQSFNLAGGQDYVQADLGFRATPGTASIGDLVWVDANNNQTRDPGEVGLAGITVDLYQDTDGDGLANGGPIASTVTGPGGAYLFTGITANGALDYVVSLNTGQAPLTGYTPTTNTLFSYPDLPSSGVRVDADFGFRCTLPGCQSFTISDAVWLDNGSPTGTANDGVRNGTEGGIAGVTIDLLDSASNTIATTTTAANGNFQFTGVPGGQNYRWRVTDQAHVLDDFYGTSASALSGNFQMTGLLGGDLDFTPLPLPHFGYNQTRTIGDTVFNDNAAGGGVLGNGAQDGTEPGISGVTVLLYRDVNGNGAFEPGGADGAPFATDVTNAFGKYLFAGLPSGSQWFVSIDNTQSALSGFNTLTTGDDSGVAGHQRLVPILTGANNNLTMDFGYQTTSPLTLSGRFFSDVNRNGVDNTEAGLQNVTIELVNGSGVVVGTAATAADGSYSFNGQPAGTYTVRITDTNGILAGAETTSEKTEGGLAGSYDGQETVILGPGSVTDVNFGFYRGNALVTRVVISSVVARDIQGALVLEWTTASEIGTVGFYLRRWDERKDRYVSVNERLIPSLIGSTQGGTYRYVDREASPGEPYRYLIVEIEASGRRLAYGPYDVDSRLTVVKADGEEEDDLAGDAGSKRDHDALLLEKGEWKAPHRGNLAKRLERRNAAREEDRRATGRRRSTAAAKIGVSENAFYFVTLQELQTLAGMTASAPWTRTYSLTNRGEPVALAPSAEGDGFWFYGRATESNVEKDNVYRLSERPGGARMGSRRNPRGQAPSGAEVFPKTLHVERDAIAVNNVFKDPDGDFYMWDYVFAGFGPRPFTFRTDGAAGTDRASVTVRLKGGSETETNPDHHATFSLNGTIVGEATWNGLGDLVTTVDFDGSLLVDGENTLVIDGLTDTGAAYSLFYVDSFDVSYTSRYRAHGNRAEVPAAGNPSVLISGFTRPDITLFDITTPNHPVFVQAPVVRAADGTYGVVASSRDPQAVYYALAPDGLVPVSRVLPDKPSSLRSSDNEAQYVVITTEALKDTAQTLADYRSDLSSMVVDVEDIYDEFNSGNSSPYALRAFLAWARTNWRTPPRYVVLAGEGTYDYKDVEGFGDNLIPTMMANTPEGLFPADAWFVERAGTVREIAIGRLPVATTAELSEVIRKIAVRETALALGEPWLRNTLLVADNTDEGGDFVQSSETVAGLVPAGSPLLRSYISSVGDAEARAGLLAEVNGGTGLVNYFGHAGFDYLADEQILKTPDVPALLNRDRPSMMFAFTCLAGNASLPGYSTLGEELLRQEGGGFAALFAPSGMSANDLATPLAAGLHGALLANDTLRIGDAVNAARRAYKRDNLPLYMLSIYNLLGDPAMRVR